MSKYAFGQKPTTKTVYLPTDAGSLQFGNGSEIDRYEFDGSESFKLEISGWWFDTAAVDDLIEFLKSAKTRLK